MLERYRQKRDFARTPEPPPAQAPAGVGPLIFVVHKHAARRLHYDFRLELDGVLKSWALPKGPSLNPKDKRLAVMVEDHPLDYRSFEGLIPPDQYGAGQVIVWDQGAYSPEADDGLSFEDREKAQQRMKSDLAKGKVSIQMWGQKLKGSWALVRMQGRGDDNWLLIKHADKFADPNRDILEEEGSVISGLTIQDLKKSLT